MTFRRAAAILGVIIIAALAVSLLMQQTARLNYQLSLQLNERQHMLVHRLLLDTAGLPIHEALSLPTGPDVDASQQFEALLNIRLHGGPVDFDGLTGTLPPPPTPAVAANLRQTQAVWAALRPALEAHAAAEPGSQAQAAAAGQVNTHTPALIDLLDEHHRLVEAEAERVNNQYVALLWVLRIALLILVALVLRSLKLRVFNPLLQLRETTRQISQGDLSTPVAVTAIPEVEQMAGSLEAMRQRLNNSAREQAALLAFSQRLLAADDALTVMDEAVLLAADLLNSEFSALVLPDSRGELVIRAVTGWPREIVGRTDIAPKSGSQTAYTTQRGEPVAVEDYAQAQPFSVPAIINEHGITSGLSVPLERGGQVVGALLVHSREQRRYSPAEIQLLSIAANQAAVAVANVESLADERRRANELEALRDTMADTLRVSELDLTDMLQLLLERAKHLLQTTQAELGILNDAGDAMAMVRQKGVQPMRIALGEGVMGRVAASREPLIVNDYSSWEGRLLNYGGGRWYASMGVPLMAGERLLGALGVIDQDPQRRFDAAHLRLLTLFGQQAALAIETARLFEAERQRVKEAETLRQSAAIVAATLEQRKAIELILQQLEHVLPFDTATVQLLADGWVVVAGGRGWPVDAQIVGTRFEIPGNNPNTIVMQERRPLILHDAPASYPVFGQGPQSHVQSWLGVPLVMHNRVIGMLAIDSARPAHFTAEHARMAAAFADQVAIAIENAQLYETALQAANTQAILYEVGREVSASLEPEQVYAAIHRATKKLMPADAFAIALLTESGREIEGVYLVDRGTRVFSERQKASDGLSGHVIATGKALHIHTPEQLADLPIAHYGHEARAVSIVAAPLRVGDTVLGVLSAQSYARGAYTTNHLHLLELLAMNAGIALSNARLFAQVQRLAITDSLTGLHNRRHLLELGEREFGRARRFKRSLAVVMLDIDNFKLVNDDHGHVVGDEILVGVAARCLAELRSIDFLGRYGGEELLAVLPESDWQGAHAACERLRLRVSQASFATRIGPIEITISLGFALDTPEYTDLSALINQADLYMYAAKAAGRNCVRPQNLPA